MDSIADDGLYEDDFAGDWPKLEPFDCPSVIELPPAAVNIIARRLRIDMADPAATTLGEKMAANEWFWRRRAGQKVTFTEVMRGGSAFGAETSTPDADPNSSSASTA